MDIIKWMILGNFKYESVYIQIASIFLMLMKTKTSDKAIEKTCDTNDWIVWWLRIMNVWNSCSGEKKMICPVLVIRNSE